MITVALLPSAEVSYAASRCGKKKYESSDDSRNA
jgi:hypothetical protein